MNEPDIAFIIANKKRKREWDEYVGYFTVIIPLCLVIVSTFSFYSIIYDDPSTLPFSTIMMIFFSSTLLLIGMSLVYLWIMRLHQNVTFKSISTPFSKSENYHFAVEVYEQNMLPIKKLPECVICDTKVSLFSWGEQITIVPLDKEILINSHPTGMGLITLMKDIANIKQFETKINDIVLREKG
jgi:hypothetical protein